jgi:flagellar protein FliS
MFSSPIKAYQQIDREADIRGSDPHRLIMLLFEGASAALSIAQTRLIEKNFAEKSIALTKAIEIINDGLASSLNLEGGGDIAANLKALYDYMLARLVHANFENDPKAIAEIQHLLEEIGGAWREMGLARQSQSAEAV